ncbi:hypothetical protein D3C86_943060 [compost metagenome]
MEHRTIVLLFPTGQWIWSEDFHFGNHQHLGKFVEVFFTKGFSDREVDEVIHDYYLTNSEHLFE